MSGTVLIFLVALILLALGIMNKKKSVIIFALIPFIMGIFFLIYWFLSTK